MIVTASDDGSPSLSVSTSVTIRLADENDNAPVFPRQTFVSTIPENSANGSFVVSLGATDADSGTNSELLYTTIGGDTNAIFQIDNRSGIVTVQRPESLNYESVRTFVVQIQVEDMGAPPAFARTVVSF